MRMNLEPADQDFLQTLNEQGSATISRLCEVAGVTPTAIRQRLIRLEASGLVGHEARRIGRGRPQHVFFLTRKGLRQLGDNYAELAILLWDELNAIEDLSVRQSVLRRLRARLVSRYGESIAGSGLPQRFEQLHQALLERGFRVEVRQDGQLPVLRENACPYQDLAEHDHSVCELEQQVYEEVLGVPLTLSHCCRDGDAYCEFRPAETAARSEGV